MQLINKKMGDLYVRMGAGSVIKLFNPNLRGHILFVCFLFVGRFDTHTLNCEIPTALG